MLRAGTDASSRSGAVGAAAVAWRVAETEREVGEGGSEAWPAGPSWRRLMKLASGPLGIPMRA